MTTAKISHRKAPKIAYGMALYTVNTKKLYDFKLVICSHIYCCNIGRKSEVPVRAMKAYGQGCACVWRYRYSS